MRTVWVGVDLNGNPLVADFGPRKTARALKVQLDKKAKEDGEKPYTYKEIEDNGLMGKADWIK